MEATIRQTAGGSAVRVELFVNHPVEAVWESLTQPEQLAKWLAQAKVELAEGGKFELVFDNTGDAMKGQVIELQSPTLLAYTWNSKDANESAVRWELLPEAEGCRLVLDHSMRASEPLPRMLAGWHAHLELLAKVLAGEQPAWSWSRWEQLREAYAQKWGE
ncbi:SRPBCC family protein [Brevibacillus agri]|uniref:SRPBCC family protein n=1 Tax=Brevibacillus agri TaxID=51101 RepID=UPI0009DD2841|nr:SRPBCC family protein [Brevibacillus agri]MED4571685.1 SRPBCC family protein [Brevibacillus agri]